MKHVRRELVGVLDLIDARAVLFADLRQMSGVSAFPVSDHHHHVRRRSDLRRLRLTLLRSIAYCIINFQICTLFF